MNGDDEDDDLMVFEESPPCTCLRAPDAGAHSWITYRKLTRHPVRRFCSRQRRNYA